MNEENKLAEALLEREWRRCFPEWRKKGESEDEQLERLLEAFRYFCANYWHIKVPGKRIKFELRDAQIETVRDWLWERFTVALKARQIGFSTLSAAFAFWLAFGWDDRQMVMISRNEREAIKLLQKAKYGYRFLEDWMKLRGPHCDVQVTKMTFYNDSFVESLPSASDPARGETLFAIFVDEIGMLPNSEEAWAAIEPVTDIGSLTDDARMGAGRVIMLGTANGEGDLLHREFVKSRGQFGNGTGKFWGVFHSWRAVPERTDAWFEAKCREMPDWQRAQEYPDNWEEAFLKSGRPVFDMEALRAIQPEEPSRGYLKQGKDGIEFVQDGGPLRVWREPEEGHRYSMGVDVAEGLEHGDFTSVHVVDAKTYEVVAHWHGHIDPDLLGAELLPLLGRWYNQALAVVEANNHGGTTLHALRRMRYFPMFYRRRNDSRNFKKQTDQMGWLTTPKSKAKAIDELNATIRDEELELFCSETIAEMRTFVREGDGKMNGSNGSHDDRVMSLAIANQGLAFVHLHEYQVKREPGPGTFGWWMRQTKLWEDDDDRSELPIGHFAVRAAA